MKIISSSSDTFTVGIKIYDNSGYPVRWDSLGKVNVSFEVAGYRAAGHSFDPQSDRPEVGLKASAFDGYPDGVLYYKYIATGYDASMTEILNEYTGRVQTDFYIQLTAAGQGSTCATAVSELVNDAGYISGGELDKTLNSSFKTINGESIVGSGNIEIQGGGSGGDENDPLFTAWLDGHSVAAGHNAWAESPYGVAIGVSSRTYSGVAINGTAARRLDTSGNVLSQGDGIAVGGNVQATGGVAVGKSANVQMNADRSVAIGQRSWVGRNAADSVAIGAAARANEPRSIVIGSDAVSHGENTLTIGCGVKSPEQIYLGDTTLKDAIGELSGGSIAVDSELSADSTNPVQNRVVTAEFQKVNAAVSTVNGSIPKRTSQLTNDSGYITEHQSLDNYYTKEQTNNLIPAKTSQLTNDSGYVNGADVDNKIDHKIPVNVSQLVNDAGYLDQAGLKSSLKTINGESVVGSGDIAVTAGGSIAVDAELSADSTNPVQNKVITGRINELAAAIPTKTSQLTNDSGYLTEHQSLENYYTKEQTDSSINAVKTAIPTNTSQLNNDSGYLTEHQSLDDYYTKSQVDSSINAVKTTIPTKISQLTNDSGYLTEHQSLADYYTKSQVDGSINAVRDAIPVNVSQLNNDSGYLTEHQSLDGYAKISAIPTKTSQLTNDSGYLTEHQSLENYYTKEQTDSSINAVKDAIPVNVSQLTNDSGYLTEHQSLDNYYTKTQTDAKIDEKINAAGPVNEADPVFTAWKNNNTLTAGYNASVIADSSYGVAVGQYSLAGKHATAVGSAAHADGTYSTAIGNASSAADGDSVAIGRGVTSHGENTFNIRPTKLDKIYLGDNTLKSLTDTLYMGVKTSGSTTDSSVALSADKFVTITPGNSLTLTFADTDWQANGREYSCAVVCAGVVTLTVPEGVRWNRSAPSMAAGKTYLLSFFNGYCAWGVF